MDTSDRLIEVTTFYVAEARRCTKSRAYLAASIMEAAALEAALQAMCCIYPGDVKRTAVYRHKHFRGSRNKALEFSLNELINIAAEIGWFPSTTIKYGTRKTNLAELAHQSRLIRNLVHPGVWARERSGTTKPDRHMYAAVYDVFEIANSWLLHRVEKSLRRAMERDKRDKKP